MSVSIQHIVRLYQSVSNRLNFMQPIALLAARLYVAWVFFTAGLTKLVDWNSTLFLFEEEYHVPFIPFELAAYLGTAGEIIFPVLLALGVVSRGGALGLTIVNIVAVVSLDEIAPAAFNAHVIWGVLLAQIILFGAGKISLDHWLAKRVGKLG